MGNLTDNNIVEQLRSEDNEAFERLYHYYFPAILSFIKRNKGNEADAEDIFQEAVLVLIQKIRQPDFILTSALKTYLFAISKNLWLKKLRANKLSTYDNLEICQNDVELPFEESEKSRDQKLAGWLKKITENCQKILMAIFFYKEPMDNLIKKMGWKNKHTAANQQYKCIQQLKKQRAIEEGT
ncbi:MAG: sigma-70 family RNA polymerase sigma factor [Sporocytophaga sp.]|uniref:RNA polymerase sigma factor n=1 Tax=Sporocytophaga sp. TaxID=2231183 RepID=UPI001B23289A|nr:sigma-70 family RNA polymerase sigma factor [Sporocytophaga sp.]MBO9701665.1 sigma-70 family RNA polymerase sigma factor [Sporocytophaga sp.]